MSLGRSLRRFAADTRGAAAAEFVLWVTALLVPILSAFDLGAYAYQKMQAQIAAQAAVQYVWHVCDYTIGGTPAFSATKCPKLTLANVTTAAQDTTLGTGVTVTSVGEGYYCVDAAGALKGPFGSASTKIGTAPTPPSPNTCANVIPGSTTPPGDYVSATVSYTFQPLFSGLSIVDLLTSSSPITQTAYVRLNEG
jgi:Flp pilus assembly protein TadG